MTAVTWGHVDPEGQAREVWERGVTMATELSPAPQKSSEKTAKG